MEKKLLAKDVVTGGEHVAFVSAGKGQVKLEISSNDLRRRLNKNMLGHLVANLGSVQANEEIWFKTARGKSLAGFSFEISKNTIGFVITEIVDAGKEPETIGANMVKIAA